MGDGYDFTQDLPGMCYPAGHGSGPALAGWRPPPAEPGYWLPEGRAVAPGPEARAARALARNSPGPATPLAPGLSNRSESYRPSDVPPVASHEGFAASQAPGGHAAPQAPEGGYILHLRLDLRLLLLILAAALAVLALLPNQPAVPFLYPQLAAPSYV